VAITNTRIIQDQKNFFSHVLELLVGMIEISRPRMVEHPTRAARLACAITRAMGGDEFEYRMMYYAGLLHDIGYVGFKNPKVLAEMGILSPVEEQHPMMSVKMLEGIRLLDGAIPIIKHHHERWDGQGFPAKLKEEAIPVGARILALVETIEDLRMNAGVPPEELRARAVAEIKAGRGTRFVLTFPTLSPPA
jgi:response regulator RpfG family c-di-GMP phosphodiesterase